MDCSDKYSSTLGYAELHCISNFTFLRGASHPEELVRQARRLNYSAIALTDECSMAGIVRAHSQAREEGIKLIVGAEFYMQEGLHFVLLATTKQSYASLSKLITVSRRKAEKGNYFLNREIFSEHFPRGCLLIWLPETGAEEKSDSESLGYLKKHFPDSCWIGVELLLNGSDKEYLARLKNLGEETRTPLCACGDVHMHLRSRRFLQDTLTAIRLNRTLRELGYATHPNAERHLRTKKQLTHIFPPELMEETLRITERCKFSLDELKYEYPSELVPEEHSPDSWLRHLVKEGSRKRWGKTIPVKVGRLIEHELKLINELHYEQYFLTVHDLVKFARTNGILCQGRGSAANSSVCYCLGITEVDPERMDLLFERFISRERNEPPDIDVDFEHERREEVIQYVYKKYGRDRAALTATVITYRLRSAIRDVGKALGMELAQVQRLNKAIAWWDKDVSARLSAAGFSINSPLIQKFIYLISELLGFPRHLSQHVGGFVINDKPLFNLVPVENASMPGRTVIQWEKHDLEALGLLKIDVLSLGMLTAIRKAIALVNSYSSDFLSMQTIPPEDPGVYKMMQKADTIGVFQIESRAQMSMLPRLKPESYYDLVIQIAIVRPGPIQGEMVHPYLSRRSGREAVSYPSQAVKTVLERTLGVPIFQEQVMQLAIVAAGFTPGEADQLRRCMAAWNRKGGLEKFQIKLLQGMKQRGYSESFAEQIFKQIKGFGEYGFPESHSASFALLAYVSSWLKCYHPAAFTCALLNSQPMGFYAPSQLVQDASRHGVTILPVDINKSDYDCTLVRYNNNTELRLGLRMVKGLSENGARTLLKIREQALFRNISQLYAATGLSKKDLESLADADVFNSISGDRYRSYWEVLGLTPPLPLLPDEDEKKTELLLPKPSEAVNILGDYASTGLSLRRHPLALLREELDKHQIVTANSLWELKNNSIAKTLGIVTCRQRPGTASGVMFFTLEDETGFINVVIWASLINEYRHFINTVKLLEVSGTVQKQDGVLHLLAKNLSDRSSWLGKLQLHSRDFC